MTRYGHLAVPLIVMVCLLAAKLTSPTFYKKLIIEDGVVEYATAGVYFAAFICGVLLTRRVHAQGSSGWAAFYALMSLGFLFVALEEISWGQRVLRLDSPDFFEERNIQGEIGLHNLSGFRLLLHPAYIAIGFVGAFGYLILSRIGLPATTLERLLPPPRFLLYFVPCFLFYLAAEIISPVTTVSYSGELAAVYGRSLDDPRGILALPAHLLDIVRDWLPMWAGTGGKRFQVWRHQEPVELLLSLGFLSFLLHRLRKE